MRRGQQGTYQSAMDVYGQPMTTMNNTIEQQAEHTLDNLIISEPIPLTSTTATNQTSAAS
jgi:hypothetical protein